MKMDSIQAEQALLAKRSAEIEEEKRMIQERQKFLEEKDTWAKDKQRLEEENVVLKRKVKQLMGFLSGMEEHGSTLTRRSPSTMLR